MEIQTFINVGQDPDNSFVHFMAKLGFTQLVWGSTHDKGGTIDQVFVNSNLREDVSIRKIRVSFSDHDLMRIILKKLEQS